MRVLRTRVRFVVLSMAVSTGVVPAVARGAASSPPVDDGVASNTVDTKKPVIAPARAVARSTGTRSATASGPPASTARAAPDAGIAGTRPALRPASRPVAGAVPRPAANAVSSAHAADAPRTAAKAAPSAATGRSARPSPVAVRRTLVAQAPVSSSSFDYVRRPDVIAFIDDLVAREHFDRDALLRLFADVRYNATAARLMMPSSSGVRRDWNVYRARFVEPQRLAAGFRFWDDNVALLDRAEREFGVPAEIIVGILGVETVYGRNTGSFRVVDALTTLAFDYPNKQRDRSAFFREQLADALLWSRDGGGDVSALRGSYAGAIGMPQFMPGSIRQYALDYDGDGRVDLVDSVADVIGSVANFLAQQGWVRDLPVCVPLSGASGIDAAQSARIDAMVDAGSVPSLAYADLAAVGLTARSPPLATLALIDLPSGNDATGRPAVAYLAGTQNFHAITRYNRSYFYAFSVVELGSTIKALRDAR